MAPLENVSGDASRRILDSSVQVGKIPTFPTLYLKIDQKPQTITTIIWHNDVKKCLLTGFISLSLSFIYVSYMFSEHDYIKALNAYDKEVEELKRRLKKNPDWVN